jgi:hypothetical protein
MERHFQITGADVDSEKAEATFNLREDGKDFVGHLDEYPPTGHEMITLRGRRSMIIPHVELRIEGVEDAYSAHGYIMVDNENNISAGAFCASSEQSI